MQADLLEADTVIKGELSQSLLDAINFEAQDLREHEDILSICGVQFERSQIPDIPLERCAELKAENNKVTFEDGRYYKYHDRNGNTVVMACRKGDVAQPYSERTKGLWREDSYRISEFWDIMASNGTYIYLYYSREEVEEYLNSAGIMEGFYSISTSVHQQEYFYSEDIHIGHCVLKEMYDRHYFAMTQDGYQWMVKDYGAGAVFKVDGKEYVLKEDGTLDVPYGADIYVVEYPPRKQKNDTENIG